MAANAQRRLFFEVLFRGMSNARPAKSTVHANEI
jgi:hypothetical protein